MSIDHIKKQAKRLSRLLPAHLATYPDPSTLSACQELAAQSNGYPNFHAAATSKDVLVQTTSRDEIRAKIRARIDLIRGPMKSGEATIYADARNQPEVVRRKLWRTHFDKVIFIGSVDLKLKQELLESGHQVEVVETFPETLPEGVRVVTANDHLLPIRRWNIHSLNHEGGLIEIGGVVASMSRETIKSLAVAYAEIHKQIGNTKASIIVPSVSPENGWTVVGFVVERNVYSLNLRGVCWEVSPEVLDGFINEGALPFLANAERSSNAF